MKVADLMSTDLQAVRQTTTLAEAVVTLADAGVYGVPVLDARDRLVGVLSSRDIIEAEAECNDPEERAQLFQRTLVRDLMTPKPATVKPDAEIRTAALEMLYLDVHRIFVEEDGELLGVISQSDIVRAVATAKI